MGDFFASRIIPGKSKIDLPDWRENYIDSVSLFVFLRKFPRQINWIQSLKRYRYNNNPITHKCFNNKKILYKQLQRISHFYKTVSVGKIFVSLYLRSPILQEYCVHVPANAAVGHFNTTMTADGHEADQVTALDLDLQIHTYRTKDSAGDGQKRLN